MLNSDIEADVICKFTRDEGLIPLKVRFPDDEGVEQEYKILGYKETGAATRINGVILGPRSFLCKINVYNREVVINLIYFQQEEKWVVRRSN